MKIKTFKFVIQEHSKAGEVHWDLMLEAGPVLKTYRLELPPEKLLGQQTTATKIFDHPVKFLSYEGSVNKGRGTVKIADTGRYRILREGKKRCELQLQGNTLKGKFTLTHLASDKWNWSPS